MVVRSIRNQYLGINAHLHSLWQGQGGWSGFHTTQIGDLFKLLNAQLLPIGYIAEVEESLQIRRVDGIGRNPRADVLIFDTGMPRAGMSATLDVSPAVSVPALELFAEDHLSEKPYRALVIYALTEEQQRKGEPVVWIELLSPSNKTGQDAEDYHGKRMDILHAGVVFVEIDYLHETPSTIPVLPPYLFRGEVAPDYAPHPYHLLVIDLRMREAPVRVRGFDVEFVCGFAGDGVRGRPSW